MATVIWVHRSLPRYSLSHGAQRIGAVLSSRARDSQSRGILPLRGVRQGLSLASSRPIDSTAHSLLGGRDIDRRGDLHLRRRGRFEKPGAAVNFEGIDLCADVERSQSLSFVFEMAQMASRNSIRLYSDASLLCHCSYRHGDNWGNSPASMLRYTLLGAITIPLAVAGSLLVGSGIASLRGPGRSRERTPSG